MEDQLITFNTALFAKTKGFNIPTRVSYYEDTQELVPWSRDLVNKNELFNRVAAPTQSLLQKWLREQHNINVSVETGWSNGHFVYEIILWNMSDDTLLDEVFDTYESALEYGLQKALKLI